MEPAVSSSCETEGQKLLHFEGTLREFLDELLRQPRRVRVRHDATGGAGSASHGPQPPTEYPTLEFDSVTIIEKSVPYPIEELRDCAAWWNKTYRGSDDFCFSIHALSIGVDLKTEEDRPAWANLLTCVIGNLLSWGSILSLSFSHDRGWFSGNMSRETGAKILLAALSSSKTLKCLSLADLDFGRAGMTVALMGLILRLPLITLSLCDCNIGSESTSAILQAVLNPGTARFRHLGLHLDMSLDGSYARPLTWLATNQTLQRLYLHGSFTFDAVRSLSSALKDNRCLRSLSLWSTLCGDWGFGDFGEMLAVNTSLESLQLEAPRFLASDLELFSMGLRTNRTLKRLLLYTTTFENMGEFCCGLHPLIETIRYHNTTLEDLTLPNPVMSYARHNYTYRIYKMLHFHQVFRAACPALRRGEDLVRWLPLLGSSHPRYKATVLFFWARLRAETVAQTVKKWAVVEKEEEAVAAVRDSVAAVEDPPLDEAAPAQSTTSWRFVSCIYHTLTSSAAHLQQTLLFPLQSNPELNRMIAPQGAAGD